MSRSQILKRAFSSFTLLISFLAFSLNAQSAIITQYGNDVSFTYDDATLLGTASVVNNSLAFAPTSFSATASGLNQVNTSALNLNIQVAILDSSYIFNQVGVFQSGDYTLIGAGSSVNVTSSLNIDTNLDGVNEISSSIVSNSDLTINDGLFYNWNALSIEDLASYQTSTIELDFETILEAQTDSQNGLAFIAQKLDLIGLSLELSPISVPEPSSALLLLLALLGLRQMSMQRR